MPNLTEDEARRRFASQRAVRMATVDEAGRPHVVVHTFALDGDRIVHAIDHKPKRTPELRRLANIRAHPAVSVLADHYSDEWEDLWWARADGEAHIVEPETESWRSAVQLLRSRYRQYQEHPPEGPVIAVEVTRWSGWSYSEPGGGTSIT
jgi:PPOX class probable F420-dependent enzyme